MSLANKILNAAMKSEKHVFVSYSPHVEALDVTVHPTNTEYQSDERIYLIRETVHLDWVGADERLAELLEKVEGL